MRELRPVEDLLLPRDQLTVWVRAETWNCPYCDAVPSASTTVDWLGSDVTGPNGRCRECGVKLVLARMGEAVPDPQGVEWCTRCLGYRLEGHSLAHRELRAA
ncbi:MAG: hypothetical protein U0360_03860 [Dehalococcoidia bacterium]